MERQHPAHTQHLKTYMKGMKHAAPDKKVETRKTGKCKAADIPRSTRGQLTYKHASKNHSRVRATGVQSINDSLPNDVLRKIFEYVTPSDLLRLTTVCKLWMSLALDSNHWKHIFYSLPKEVQNISVIAKTCQDVDWKKESLRCCRKWRKIFVNKKINAKKPDFGTKCTDIVRFLDVRWLLVIEDTNGNTFELLSQENYFFSSSLTVRWIDLNVPPVKKIRKMTMFSLCPIFYTKERHPQVDSVCTRSMIQEFCFPDGIVWSPSNTVGEDSNVLIFKNQNFIFGVWAGQLQDLSNTELAFITCSLLFRDDLEERLISGTSTRPFVPAEHKIYEDDIDPKYDELSGDFLTISHTRDSSYSFYDINKRIEFPWRTPALKGRIQNACIIDFTLMDQNRTPIWSISQAARIEEECQDSLSVIYDFDDGELRHIGITDGNDKTLDLLLITNNTSNVSVIIQLDVKLSKVFINQWFGVAY